MSLLGELLLTESIQDKELLGQDIIFLETTSCQLDLHDDLPVWHHHSHPTEEGLQAKKKLLQAGMSEVLTGCQEVQQQQA